jgi:hypothetical protein
MNQGGAKRRRNLSREQTKAFRVWLKAICTRFKIKRPSLTYSRTESASLNNAEVVSLALARKLINRLMEHLVPAHLNAGEWALLQTDNAVVWSLVSSPVYSAALTDAQLRARGREPKLYKAYALSVGEIKERYGDVDIKEFKKSHAPRLPLLIPSGLEASFARALVEMLCADDVLPRRSRNKVATALERRLLDMQAGCSNAFAQHVGRMVDSKQTFRSMINDAKRNAKRIGPGQEMTMLLFALVRLCGPDPDGSPSS